MRFDNVHGREAHEHVGELLLCCVVGVCVSGCADVSAGADPVVSASAEELAAAFALSSEPPADWGNGPARDADRPAEWERLTSVENADPAPSTGAVRERVVVHTDGEPARTIELHTGYRPGIDWALAHDAEVWLLMADKAAIPGYDVAAVMILTPTEVFFPGGCMDRTYGTLVRDRFGGDARAVMRQLTQMSNQEAAELLGVAPTPDPEPEPGPRPVVLNPADAPPGLLASLNSIRLNVRITQALGLGETSPALCTRIPAGWNDCLNTDAVTVAGDTLSPVYVDDSGQLEFWLIGEGGLRRPLGYLGTVIIPDAGTTFHTVSLTVNTTDLDPTTLPTTSTNTTGLLRDVEIRPGG